MEEIQQQISQLQHNLLYLCGYVRKDKIRRFETAVRNLIEELKNMEISEIRPLVLDRRYNLHKEIASTMEKNPELRNPRFVADFRYKPCDYVNRSRRFGFSFSFDHRIAVIAFESNDQYVFKIYTYTTKP